MHADIVYSFVAGGSLSCCCIDKGGSALTLIYKMGGHGGCSSRRPRSGWIRHLLTPPPGCSHELISIYPSFYLSSSAVRAKIIVLLAFTL